MLADYEPSYISPSVMNDHTQTLAVHKHLDAARGTQ